MKSIGLKASFLIILLLTLSSSAMATIETIKGTLMCFLGCNKNITQFVAQGEQHSFEVIGQSVDLSTAVEITGSGVSVSYGTRKHGSNSSIIVKFDVDDNATPGERTVKMRYAIETNGPDTFKIKVVKKGSISQIRYRRLSQTSGIVQTNPNLSNPNTSTQNITAQISSGEGSLATNIPLNERIVLIVTGTKLDGVRIRSGGNYQNERVLSGATDTRCEIEIEFTRSGQEYLLLFDSNLSSQDTTASTNSKFSYGGGENRKIQYGSGQVSGGNVFLPIAGGSGGGSNTFVDVAPRANMQNIFRRQNQSPAFTENGAQYFSINSEQFCNGMTGNQSRIITVPNPVWGVTNVGTADINTAFASQLRSGTQVLATENLNGLNPAETRNFTFVRQDSRVRVFTFAARNGCFISPTADEFFEDPPFTVIVNTNNALTEATANQANNSRNY